MLIFMRVSDLWNAVRSRRNVTGQRPFAGAVAQPAGRGPGAAVDRDDRAGDITAHVRGEEYRNAAAFRVDALAGQRQASRDRRTLRGCRGYPFARIDRPAVIEIGRAHV